MPSLLRRAGEVLLQRVFVVKAGDVGDCALALALHREEPTSGSYFNSVHRCCGKSDGGGSVSLGPADG